MERTETYVEARDTDGKGTAVYFSCPKFTVRLVVKDTVIREAAPIVKTFEGQTIGALATWARSKFGGPVIVKRIS